MKTTATLYLVQKLDSRLGGKTYAFWTEGEVFAVQYNSSVLFLGYNNFPSTTRVYNHTQITSKADAYLVPAEKWQQITFGDLPPYCMEEVLRMVSPDVIPWAETRWVSYEDYLEWESPTTLEGKLKKSLRNPREFPKEELSKVSQVYFLGKDGHSLAYEANYLYQTPWGWYKYRVGFYYTEGYSYGLHQISEEKAQEELRKKEKRELQEQLEKKEYGRNCARLARKYQLPWKIISIFNGNEEEIKNFLNTLKEAIEQHKEFDANELCCGRARRRNELNRLGIYIGYVDANKIADFILDCLEKKAISNKY